MYICKLLLSKLSSHGFDALKRQKGARFQCLKCRTLVKRSDTPYLLQQSIASPSLMLPPGSAITPIPLSHASSTASFQADHRTDITCININSFYEISFGGAILPLHEYSTSFY